MSCLRRPGPRGRMVCALCTAAALLVLLADPAIPALHAAPGGPVDPAMSALSLAKHYYRKGDYAMAARRFHEAYVLNPRPEFLFNAARAEHKALLLEAAAQHYRACLAAKGAPDEVLRRARIYLAEVEAMRKALVAARASGRKVAEREMRARLSRGAGGDQRELQGMAGIQGRGPAGPTADRAAPPPAAATPAGAKAPAAGARAAGKAKTRPASTRVVWPEIAGWGGVGGGALLLGVGGWLAVSYATGQTALNDKTARRNDGGGILGIDRERYVAEQERLNRLAAWRTTTLVAGALAVGAGAWLLASGHGLQSVSVAPRPRGLLVAMRF